ncbi:MAG: ATP synthase F1 subunit epsilon [Prevotellaceae bacterium]|jgi:F-type H+-transporting ATPase subunit epsilon|nr:ATP synthase F1 subunit epsilon [Prevotellaceae bacterium]
MQLEIKSPEKSLFSGKVDVVHLPGTKGEFTVLPRHAAIISTLREGKITCRRGKEEWDFDIKSGIAEVKNDVITVCVE